MLSLQTVRSSRPSRSGKGEFGAHIGLLAGFLHSSVAMRSGLAASGLNLYNNGFSGGLIVLVLFAVLTALSKKKRAQFANSPLVPPES